MRTGKESSKKQSMKARRDDSYGAWGKRGSEHRHISMEKGGETWVQDSEEEMKRKGTVGLFTRKAKAAGMSTVEYAKKVLDPKNEKRWKWRVQSAR